MQGWSQSNRIVFLVIVAALSALLILEGDIVAAFLFTILVVALILFIQVIHKASKGEFSSPKFHFVLKKAKVAILVLSYSIATVFAVVFLTSPYLDAFEAALFLIAAGAFHVLVEWVFKSIIEYVDLSQN